MLRRNFNVAARRAVGLASLQSTSFVSRRWCSAKPPPSTAGAEDVEKKKPATDAPKADEPAPTPEATKATPPPPQPESTSTTTPATEESPDHYEMPPPRPDPRTTTTGKPDLLGYNIPKGFEAAYQFPFKRPGEVPLRVAIEPTSKEMEIIERMEKRRRNAARRRNLGILSVLSFIGGAYYIEQHYRLANVFKFLSIKMGIDTLDGEEGADAGDFLKRLEKPEIASIWVNLDKHMANFYDATGMFISGRNFVDFGNFENNVKQDSETSVASMFLSIPTYYPWIPMGLLLLIPCLAFFQDSFTVASRAANKAVNALGKGGDKKFRFKTDKHVKTRLDDVAGLTEAKHEIVEIIDFLKKPERYQMLGARLPKGVLLDGPPGVGKTLIAKAVAGEAVVPFVSCSGSEFDEVFVGVGAQRVRELFKEARKAAPCVVFIDEIDAFGKKRQSDGRGGSRGTLNALLSELDGFKDATGIIVLAATNRSDILDGALTRSGRFDRKISLEKPPHKDRVEICKVHLKPLVLEPALDIDSAAEQLASLTPGCSGADIYNICNEAAITASREGRDNVNMSCFHKALERVLVGMTKKSKKFTVDEKRRLAYHEAGHVVLQWFQTKTDPVVKASIVPRGGDKVGVTQKLPSDKFIVTQNELHQRMVSRLGGYVAEELFFEDLSTSASEDLRAVTEMAWHEITTYGMDPSTVGHFHYETNESAIAKPFGPTKENEIDSSVSSLVGSSLQTARDLLRKHILQVRIVGGMLLKEETIGAHELWRLLGDRPEMSAEFRKFLETKH